jgi:aryl carrier-like protein
MGEAPRASSQPGGLARPPDVEALCALFAQVLGVSQVEPDDDFFHCGGHSQLVLRLASRLRGRYGVTVSIADVFDNPTPAGLSACLNTPDSETPPLLGRLRASHLTRPGSS